MSNSNRTRKDEDRYFRDTIIVTAYARNLGLQWKNNEKGFALVLSLVLLLAMSLMGELL